MQGRDKGPDEGLSNGGHPCFDKTLHAFATITRMHFITLPTSPPLLAWLLEGLMNILPFRLTSFGDADQSATYEYAASCWHSSDRHCVEDSRVSPSITISFVLVVERLTETSYTVKKILCNILQEFAQIRTSRHCQCRLLVSGK